MAFYAGQAAAVLVEPGDAGRMAEAAVALAGDPARRSAMSGAGRRQSLLFDWKHIAERTIALYAALLNR
jgi:phosphatidylinositol alpha-mannosyltransferase